MREIGLADEEIFAFCRLLLPAGAETTYRSSSNLMVGLLTNPEQLDAVVTDRSLVPPAIEEGIRWEPPRGIGVLERGAWAIPVIFGVDAESRAAAVAFAIDHNNLTLLGGGLSIEDVLQIWDESALQSILSEIPDAGKLLASLDAADLDALLAGPKFDPVGEDGQPRLDEKKTVTCPQCGNTFKP